MSVRSGSGSTRARSTYYRTSSADARHASRITRWGYSAGTHSCSTTARRRLRLATSPLLADRNGRAPRSATTTRTPQPPRQRRPTGYGRAGGRRKATSARSAASRSATIPGSPPGPNCGRARPLQRHNSADQLARHRRFFRALRSDSGRASALASARRTERHDENTWTSSRLLDLLRDAAARSPRDSARRDPVQRVDRHQVLEHEAGDQLAWAAAIGVGTGRARTPSRLRPPRGQRRRPQRARRSRPPGPRGRGIRADDGRIAALPRPRPPVGRGPGAADLAGAPRYKPARTSLRMPGVLVGTAACRQASSSTCR